MSSQRWNPYLLVNGEKINDFWKSLYEGTHKILYILGKGFDVRMNIGVETLINNKPDIDLDCLLVEFDEGEGSHSTNYQDIVDENITELKGILGSRPIIPKTIQLWNSKDKKSKRVGAREAATSIIEDDSNIEGYTDILIDISSLPRGIYFSLIGKVLSIIDSVPNLNINLFVIVAENAEIDSLIKDKAPDDDLDYLHGFSAQLNLAAEIDKPTVWFPILGEDKSQHINKAFNHVRQSQTSLLEICPTLPYPSKNPRRADQLIIDYHELLFDELAIESQNIVYVPEQNPFEAYISLYNAIKNYNVSLQPLNGCKVVISAFTSKLLSIGALLVAYELKAENQIGIGILNVDSKGYEINDIDKVKSLKDDSELFVTWLAGKPYS